MALPRSGKRKWASTALPSTAWLPTARCRTILPLTAGGSRFTGHDFFASIGNISASDRAKRQRTGVLDRPFAKPEEVALQCSISPPTRKLHHRAGVTVDGGTLL